MTEAQLTTIAKHAIERLHPTETVVYEFKMVKTRRFNFKAVAEHQVIGLQNALRGLWVKLADMSAINGFGARKPFDSIWIIASHAYVCPIFYRPRKSKTMYLIPVNKFVKLEGKSATEEELAEFCSIEL